ncbi:heavy metal-binding domain-containing protein [Flavobacterium luteum]|uniref:YbjQ family protein n=1 Tax=Flavobacterium luteum TaxID=2026654 RepID=A0A7J5AHF0_9FLAO|nr:heavy metal-binding domain-containing protein [Flavobacterium luteum]KAB1157031.1 YbjQ family protein [Flavobacterium luteum]
MKNIIYLSILFVFVSCSIKTHYVQTGSKTYQPTEPTSILIYSRTPEKRFEVIGSVAVHASGQKHAIKVLKKKAAALGADAVIDINLDKIASYTQTCGINGTAIKFK